MNGHVPLPSCDHILKAHKLCLQLNDIMMLINSSHDIDEILHEIVQASCEALGCESSRIALREGDDWVIRYVNHLPDDLLGRSFTDHDLPHAALAMTTKKPVAIDDAFHDDRTNTEMMVSLDIKSLLVLPLMNNDKVIGTLLYGYHSRAISFTDTEIDYAERMATGVAIALQSAGLYQDLAESNRLSDALNEIDTVLHSTNDYDAIMNKMLQLATDVIGAESAVIFSKDDDRWTVRYEYLLPVSLIGQNFSNTEVMHTAVTAQTKRSLVVQDALNSPEIDQKFVEMLGIRSLLDFPLILKGVVIGDLTFHYHSSPVPFNERQIEFVRKLQISISLALENDRLLNISMQSESMLKEAERLGKSGYFKYDVITGNLTWSEGVFHLFGRDPELGEPTIEEFFDLYSVDPGPKEMRKLVGDQETTELDAKITRGDAAYFFHLVIRSVKNDKGDVVAFMGTVQDITQRRHNEEALKLSEQQMYYATTAADLGVWNWDLVNNEIVWSQKSKEIFGYPPDYPITYQSIRSAVHEDDRPRIDQVVQQALQSKAEYLDEMRVVLPDGQVRWIMSKGHGYYDDRGAPVSMHGIIMDITDRVRAKLEIDRLNRELSERATELEVANKELEAFNYTVAHDLRAPLNHTGLYLQTLQQLYGAGLDETAREYLAGGHKNVQRMSQLIDVLLEFSRMKTVEPLREDVDISAMAREIAEELKRTSPERHCIFHIAEGIRVNGDPKLLRVALNNLMQNAWKYTGKKEETVIEVGATELGAKQVYFIRDNGRGFDPADTDKLFTPFQRLPGAEEFKGSGIGLATVERVIQRHGGKVWAEGEPNRGACFYFTLSEH
jgi:PAS domain S-box-containing protein